MSLAGIAACATGSTETGERSSTTVEFPTPAYNGDNGAEASLTSGEGASVESLADWTHKADFVALATVTGESLIEPKSLAPGLKPEMWTTLRRASIDRIIWQSPEGEAGPDKLSFVGMGWQRNNDTGSVTALLPSKGERLDVGDQYVGAFKFLGPPGQGHEGEYRSMPSHWGHLGGGTLEVESGEIKTSDRTPEFLLSFDGESVDAFARRVRATAPS